MAKVYFTPDEWAGLMPCFSTEGMQRHAHWGKQIAEAVRDGSPINLPNEAIIGILDGTCGVRCGPAGWRGVLVRALATWVNLPDREREGVLKERIAELQHEVDRLTGLNTAEPDLAKPAEGYSLRSCKDSQNVYDRDKWWWCLEEPDPEGYEDTEAAAIAATHAHAERLRHR
jgi:hypothetical protein